MILVAVRDHQGFQISLLLSLSVLFQALLIKARPFEDPTDTYMTLFNEIATSLYLYQALLLTDSAVEPPLRPQLGNQLGIFVIAVLAVNIVRAAVKIVKGLRVWCKRRQLRRSQTIKMRPELLPLSQTN